MFPRPVSRNCPASHNVLSNNIVLASICPLVNTTKPNPTLSITHLKNTNIHQNEALSNEFNYINSHLPTNPKLVPCPILVYTSTMPNISRVSHSDISESSTYAYHHSYNSTSFQDKSSTNSSANFILATNDMSNSI